MLRFGDASQDRDSEKGCPQTILAEAVVQVMPTMEVSLLSKVGTKVLVSRLLRIIRTTLEAMVYTTT